MNKIASLLVVAFLAGCAAAPAPAPVQVASAEAAAPAASGVPARQVCQRETVIGSHRAQTICYTPGAQDDPNVAAVTGDLSRQIGLNQAMAARAGKN